MDKIVHALTPIATIGAATALCALGKIDSSTAVAIIGTAGGLGSVIVSRGANGGSAK